MNTIMQNCSVCIHKDACTKNVQFMDDYGQILKKMINYCSNFSKKNEYFFESKFHQYIKLKNYGKEHILALARVISEDNKEIFIISVDNITQLDVKNVFNKAFPKESYVVVEKDNFENKITNYQIIEKIIF